MPVKIPERIDRFDGPFRFLSNFAWLDDGKTLEHYYQAAKAIHQLEFDWVMAARTPAEAKKRGRQVQCRTDWEAVKNGIMLDLLRAKFAEEPFRSQLLATGTSHLEEGNWWGDRYWGTVSGVGENWLGRLLMQVRDELREEGGDGRRSGSGRPESDTGSDS